MEIRKGIVLSAFFFLFLSFGSTTIARKVGSATYRYPYKDPFIATSTVALLQGREFLPSGEIRDLEINVLQGRDQVSLLEGMGKLRYRFYQQEGFAPLLFLVPGFGSSAYAGSARYLAEFLAGHGFHVLVLPSPFNWNFTLAASRSGFPGVVQEDALDLYYAMRLVMDFVKKQRRARVGRIGMLGLSDGARYTAFMSPIDAARKQIGIDTYLLINPPVDLLKAANKIDSMAELGNHLGQKQREVLEAYAFGTVDNALQNDPAAREYFEDWNVRFHLTDHQIAYLIGNELQKNVGDAIYTSSLSCDRGALKTPISWGYRTERLEEARSYTIIGYLKKFLIPGIKRSSGKDISVKELNEQTSLKAIPSILANQKNIFLMHNLDDFLISKEGFAYLERVFGDRAIFYPYGGHLGNLWYTENQKDMLRLLNPLFSHYDRRAPRGF